MIDKNNPGTTKFEGFAKLREYCKLQIWRILPNYGKLLILSKPQLSSIQPKLKVSFKRKQAEAEIVPSSSLVEVEVDVGVGVWGVRVGVGLTFSVGWVGGWRFGE